MSLKPELKKAWIEFQRRSNVPVNGIGIKIEPNDKDTLRVWMEEGINQYMRKQAIVRS